MPRTPDSLRPHATVRTARRPPRPADPPGLDELVQDLAVLVTLGLIEERASPWGALYELTELGRSVPPANGGH